MKIQVRLNDAPITEEIEPSTILLDFLRDKVNVTGPKEGCGVGVCGACTVLVDDEPVSSCIALAACVDGASIWTAEGLAERFPKVAQSFAEREGLQCGICTPGQVVSACSLLMKDPHPDEETVRDYMAGNLCRCTGYATIVEAVRGAL